MSNLTQEYTVIEIKSGIMSNVVMISGGKMSYWYMYAVIEDEHGYKFDTIITDVDRKDLEEVRVGHKINR